ncbi:hypothetical protein VNN36_12350 (plasmid) [Lactococcus garvieae]|uniref:hypothetical protein n=1 Tax=Lactococcus garvieae TaxID=1363 RepID=UPI0030D187A9
MNLFNKILKKTNIVTSSGTSLLNKYKKGIIDEQQFLFSFSKTKVFYSTPFGDHVSGETRLFLLPDHQGSGYLPVFTSSSQAIEFYKEMGRVGFVIMEGTFIDFLETTKTINQKETPIKMGVIIEPNVYDITIEGSVLDKVINLMK